MRRLALVLLLAGCYDWDALSSTLDFGGNYSIVVTNDQNGCMVANWVVGNMSAAIALDINQSGGNQVDAQIGGGVGDYINFFCGSKDLIGSVSGNRMDASLMCTRGSMMGTCTFRYLAHAQATLDGNHIMGTLDYTTIIMGQTDSADCAPLRNCRSTQTFSGSR